MLGVCKWFCGCRFESRLENRLTRIDVCISLDSWEVVRVGTKSCYTIRMNRDGCLHVVVWSVVLVQLVQLPVYVVLAVRQQ